MRFLYVAPRYHTNQMCMMKGLIERGDEVRFISHYRAIFEDYSYVEPIVLGYSPLYNLFDSFYMKVLHRNDLNAAGFKIQHGFPPIRKLVGIVREFKPDVVILREKSLYSIVAYQICKKQGAACILYNQKPMWGEPEKNDLAHRLVNKLSPSTRMTPVMGTPGQGKAICGNAFFIPFVAEPQTSPTERTYFAEGKIRLLCIGKYIVRKHHLEMLEAVDKLRGKYPIHLTLAGEATTRFQKEYLARVKKYIKDHQMEDCVEVLVNVARKDMDEEYKKADVCVIPSTDEPASVSQLEAMSFSLPVICSDANGGACYVEDGITGYHFMDCNQEDLERKLDLLLSDKDKMCDMGAAGYRAVIEKYGFERYYNGIMEIVEKIKTDRKMS